MRLRSLNVAIHRDLGYFFSSLTIVYCLSGLSLNHIDEWNPDFIIVREEIRLDALPAGARRLGADDVRDIDRRVGEAHHRAFDHPTNDQVKIYYENGSLHLNLATGVGTYEKLRRRPVFYESNVLHRNSPRGWKWASDAFAIALIVINVTGLLILRGRHGLGGRGKWLIVSGALPPALAVFAHVLGVAAFWAASDACRVALAS